MPLPPKPTPTFGAEWSRALCIGCAQINVRPEWVLAVLALESGFNPFAMNRDSRAFGLYQQVPRGGAPYTETDPVKQLRDAFAFWSAMITTFAIAHFPSRATFYALNLAPARLKGHPSDATVLYSNKRDLHPREYWPKGYIQNRGLDQDNKGWIAISDLEPSLARAVRLKQTRYDAELEAAYVANVLTPPKDIG